MCPRSKWFALISQPALRSVRETASLHDYTTLLTAESIPSPCLLAVVHSD